MVLFGEDVKTKKTVIKVEKKDDYILKTKNNYMFDEVASALQKEIRRSHTKEAMYWALELFESGYYKYVFRRLCTIAAEDIGNSNVPLVTSVFLISRHVQDIKKGRPDPCLLGYIVLGLCDSQKNRESDDIVNEIMRSRRAGNPDRVMLDIPDYAIDKHTKQGKLLGKTHKEFWAEGCRLEGEDVKISRFIPYVEGIGDGTNDEK